ncbi:DNA polymerase III subunit alpha [Putridiphycobacter roseus]|uniref:DNA polymerase III subunit alpha n=1 Tax=Putridiphycobacter roseus TaxID=2219161 RepID=A0A2W1N3S4_9FLAO|nr:DNA polymerase III subunit alpha [Putridiphycobacter roseus]PZE18494.1 DNA polymerase III subunit alpha [Putridiphycobacter roseus]
MYIVFDTETTGLPKRWNAPITDTDNWPRCIQIAWQVHDQWGTVVESKDYLIKPEGFNIPFDAEQIHGISTELAAQDGIELNEMLHAFNEALTKADFVVGQNVGFDLNIMGCEFHRQGIESPMLDMAVLDTCTETTAKLCQLPGGRGGKFKLPTLTELHQHLFGVPFGEAHNATADVEATARCFFELIRTNIFLSSELKQGDDYLRDYQIKNPAPFQLIGLQHLNLKEESAKIKARQTEESGPSKAEIKANIEALSDISFSHLHNHSQFSILQSTTGIVDLVQKAVAEKSDGVALTDSGNMMAAFHFVRAALNHNKSVAANIKAAEEKGETCDEKPITPIVGCEFNICKDHTDKSNKDNGYQVVLLAKNKRGYLNLAKMSSIAFTKGFYYIPRIDKKIVEQYKEDIIVLTGGTNGEIPNLILNVGEKQAEEALLWWKETFGEDLYIELIRHGLEAENIINDVLVKFAEKHHIELVATNNTFYLKKENANAHDILLCIKDGELKSTPKGRGRGFRFGLENEEYYFKSTAEMVKLFADLPEAVSNTQKIVEKCEPYPLASDILLPNFHIPEEFRDPQDEADKGTRGENNYLRYLTYEGAKKRWGEEGITEDVKERLDFELQTIANSGYPGYFLICQDFCHAAREMGVSVGPGRGSAAGSAVAYCVEITNIDPIKYNLLFERFLNPERVSMPDIDIDFDDEGRQSVIDWVIEKYGENQVAQIITYGTMAAKSSIRDTARALDLPLFEADRLAKLVPDIKLAKLFGLDDVELAEKLGNNQDDIARANELKSIANGNDLAAEVVNQARLLEGSMRNTGIHACGVIITPSDITNFVPVALAKDSGMFCTQFDNSVAEDAGLLKMDFLGLKTLTLIKDAVQIIKERHGITLIPDDFPLDDEKTYELFQKGETVGVFQYESAGMQKYLRELKPTVFADLIAMNALYRPGPLEYIPSFIRRKHGTEEIVYDIEANKEYLEETYGITVYQEQVMLLSQKLSGFSKGEADTLRKAMGKKNLALLAKMKPKFLTQGVENGHDRKALEKMWVDWEAFASYAFNKSHSTCYAYIAYQTAYLKAHYPAEYMASVLSNNMNDIKTVTFFMEECKRAGIPVLGPDVNESQYKFTVNQVGAIRFGLGAIKGVGSKPVDSIVNERKENGFFTSVFDMATRVDLRLCNKRVFENLVLAGGFDSFGNIRRSQFFTEDSAGRPFIETVTKYGARFQENVNSSQVSMFGGDSSVEIPVPQPPIADEWPTLTQLSKEKEVVGVYISGHPLDDYRLEIDSFCNGCSVSDLTHLEENKGKELFIAGIITSAEHRTTKNGKPFGTFEIEDYTDSNKQFIFGENYLRFRHLLTVGTFVFMNGKIGPKKWGEGIEFSVSTIELLADVKEKKTKSLVLTVEQADLTDMIIDDLFTVVSDHSGSCQLKFVLHDYKSKTSLKMPSRNMKVNINQELIRQIKKLEVFECKLE